MDYYQVWFDLKAGVKDTDFARGLATYMGHLKERGLIEGWKLSRRKLGLAPKQFGDFHLAIETRNLAQLDEAFNHIASRAEPVENVHFDVNSKVENALFGLYRDFPDPALKRQVAGFIGQEAVHGREHRALVQLAEEHAQLRGGPHARLRQAAGRHLEAPERRRGAR